jgi:hypothetical protein
VRDLRGDKLSTQIFRALADTANHNGYRIIN